MDVPYAKVNTTERDTLLKTGTCMGQRLPSVRPLTQDPVRRYTAKSRCGFNISCRCPATKNAGPKAGILIARLSVLRTRLVAPQMTACIVVRVGIARPKIAARDVPEEQVIVSPIPPRAGKITEVTIPQQLRTFVHLVSPAAGQSWFDDSIFSSSSRSQPRRSLQASQPVLNECSKCQRR